MAKDAREERRVKTGTKGLDEMLHGGVPEGNCFILQGPPGNEKDLIANQYVKEGLLAGECVFVVLSTISPDEFRKQLKFIGLNPKKYETSGDLMIVDWYSYKHERVKSVEEGTGEEKAVIKASFDLTNVGIAITKTIELMEKKMPKRAVINLLSSALTSFGLKTVYNFAQATRAKCRQENITTIFVLDSEAQDVKVLSTFHQIFDGLIEVSRTRTGPTLKREICILSMSGTSIESEYKDLDVEVNAISVRATGPKDAIEPEDKKEAGAASTGSGLPNLDDIFKGFLESEQKAESERTSLAKSRADTQDVDEQAVARERNAESEIREAAKPVEEDVIEEVVLGFCPECKAEVPVHVSRCPKCGVEFETEDVEVLQCPECGGTVHETDMKCPHCGVSFDDEEAKAAEEAGPEAAEVWDEEPEMELGTAADEPVTINPKDELEAMLRPWEAEGYNLDYFSKMIETDPTTARKEVMIFVSRARELSTLEKRISLIGAAKLEKALADLKRDVTSPDKSKRGGIEWSILELRGRVKQVAKARGEEAKDKKVVVRKKKKL
jgi:KaiC/GvpD/RAD55 family RecA-like ATPase/predicted Zn-ribbon and HTH transcriptional regulator